MGGGKASFVLNDRQLHQLISDIQQWMESRDRTIDRINEVADELDALHKELKAPKVVGALATVVGGAAATAGVFLTGGLSLYIAGLTAAAAGSLTTAIAEIEEHVKNKTGVETAQRMIDADRAQLANSLSILSTGIKSPSNDGKIGESSTSVDEMYELFLFGAKMYGWANTANGVYSLLQEYQACRSVLEMSAFQTSAKWAATVAKWAGPVIVASGLMYLIHHVIKEKKGNLSEAAEKIRKACKPLREERESVGVFLSKLTEEKERRIETERKNAIMIWSIIVFCVCLVYSLVNCIFRGDSC